MVVAVFFGADFAEARRRYRTFCWVDRKAYGDSVREIISVAAGAGATVEVAVIDPDALDAWCAQEHLIPDDPDSRGRYAVVGGAPVVTAAEALAALRSPLH